MSVADYSGVPLRPDAQAAAFGLLRSKEAVKDGGAMEFRIQSAEALFVRRLKDDDSVIPPLWTQVLAEHGFEIKLREDGFTVYDTSGRAAKEVDDDPYRSGLKYYLSKIPVPVKIDVTGQEYPQHVIYDDDVPSELIEMVLDGDIKAPAVYQKYLVEKRYNRNYGKGSESLYGATDIAAPLFFRHKLPPFKEEAESEDQKLGTNARTSMQFVTMFRHALRKDATLASFKEDLINWKAPLRIKQKLLEAPEYTINIRSGFKKDVRRWVKLTEVPDENHEEFMVYMLRMAVQSGTDTAKPGKAKKKRAAKSAWAHDVGGGLRVDTGAGRSESSNFWRQAYEGNRK